MRSRAFVADSCGRATISAPRCAPRPTCRARWRGCRSAAAVRAISQACATAFWPPIRRWRGSQQLDTPPPEIAAVMEALRRPSRDLAREFERALAEQLPLIKRDGGFVREGYEPALDETRNLRDASRLVVAAMQARYADDTGIKGLKIRHNNVLGYFVEVTAQHGDKLMAPPLNATFIHRQTLAGPGPLHHVRTRRDRSQDRQCRRPRARAGARKSSSGSAPWRSPPATICAPRRMPSRCSMSRPRWQNSRSTTITCGPRSMARSALPSRAAGIRWSSRR
mgnify:CR=1 FL=1